ncbi:velb gibm7recname: velvet complex subunit 2, partial [Fusarium flagelliforme]
MNSSYHPPDMSQRMPGPGYSSSIPPIHAYQQQQHPPPSLPPPNQHHHASHAPPPPPPPPSHSMPPTTIPNFRLTLQPSINS